MFDPWLISSFQAFKNAFESGRVPSSVILSGAPDLGGAFLAIEFAKLYLCSDKNRKAACEACKSCHLFDDLQNGSHPDFISLLSSTAEESDREEDLSHSFSKLLSDMGTPLENMDSEIPISKGNKSVRIDGIRNLTEWISQGSVLGNGKVAVISNAHLMGDGAANALLKTFEEPTSNTLIILLTKSLELLPPTILSRAFKIQIPTVSEPVALDYLKANLGEDFSQDRARIALALSFNSPRGALKYYKESLDIKALEIITSLIEDVSSEGNSSKTVSLILELTNEQNSLILQEVILELLKCKAGVDKGSLPLLKNQPLDKLIKIPASHLLDAYNEMKYIRADSPMLNSRAPVSLISAWLNSLKKI